MNYTLALVAMAAILVGSVLGKDADAEGYINDLLGDPKVATAIKHLMAHPQVEDMAAAERLVKSIKRQIAKDEKAEKKRMKNAENDQHNATQGA
ncbi:hypothetical protein HDE_00211 [Halotydeus destructor]|nr:hypothetical protein HDE_00211 [Halotydeus destructor]